MGLYISRLSIQALALSQIAILCAASPIGQDMLGSPDVVDFISETFMEHAGTSSSHYRPGLDNLGLGLWPASAGAFLSLWINLKSTIRFSYLFFKERKTNHHCTTSIKLEHHLLNAIEFWKVKFKFVTRNPPYKTLKRESALVHGYDLERRSKGNY